MGGRLLVMEAEDEGKIIGSSWMTWDGRRIYLHHFGIQPDWQGRGVARALIAAVQDAARGAGATRMVVATTNDDLPALVLYQRLGFTITEVLPGKLVEHHGGIEPGFASIPVRDEIRMEVTL